MRPCHSRAGWQDLPYELRWTIVEDFIKVIVRPVHEIGDRHSSGSGSSMLHYETLGDYEYLQKIIKRDDLRALWLELHNFIVAVPDMEEHVSFVLRWYCRQAWDNLRVAIAINTDVSELTDG